MNRILQMLLLLLAHNSAAYSRLLFTKFRFYLIKLSKDDPNANLN